MAGNPSVVESSVRIVGLGEQFPSVPCRCSGAKRKTLIDLCFPKMARNDMLFCLRLTYGQNIGYDHGASNDCECCARRVRGWL